jgi:hypothetical protein
MCGDFTRSSNISDDSRYCLDRLDDLEEVHRRDSRGRRGYTAGT